jgi:hypothetical protein
VTETRQTNLSAEYQRWWKRLSVDERKSLIESGAFRADDPSDATPLESRSRMNGQHFDFARAEDEKSYSNPTREMSMKSQSPAAVDEVMARESGDDQRFEHLDMAGLRLRSMLHFMLEGLDESSDTSMHLHADVIRIVVGEGRPPSMTELARKHGVSKAAVSLRCRKLLRRLGLEPSRFMRSNDEVSAMRVSAIVRATGIELSEESKRVIAKNARNNSKTKTKKK